MRRQSAPMYDLFKLIVALILLALLIWMLLRPPSGSFPGSLLPGAASSGEMSVTGPAAAAAVPATIAPSATAPQQTESAAEGITAAVEAATATNEPTPEPTATATAELRATPTSEPTLEPTAEAPAEPTTAPTIAPTPTQAAPTPTATADSGTSTTGPSADLAACAALPSRLAVGDSARVLTNLIFRSSAGIGSNAIRTHPVGTVMEVTGGPQCIPYQGGAYLWWELRHPDGTTGWSAEGSISSITYFLQPVQ